MKRIVWVTDVHLDHVDSSRIKHFCREILAAEPDALLVGGDIGEAPTVGEYLQTLGSYLQRPIYFVLGNHDFYQGSIQRVRQRMEILTRHSRWLHWLPATGMVELTPRTCLVGHDGWSDGRFGDFQSSPVVLNDYLQIDELRTLTKPQLRAQLNALGDEAAAYLRAVLTEAAAYFRRIILLTHVPPFREACLYRGKPGNDAWLPHFTCKAVGDMLLEVMENHRNCRLTVLCGHTHNAAEGWVLPNLFVQTGEADYGDPQLQAVFEL